MKDVLISNALNGKDFGVLYNQSLVEEFLVLSSRVIPVLWQKEFLVKIEVSAKGWIKRKIKSRKMPMTEIKIEKYKSFLPTDWRSRLLK